MCLPSRPAPPPQPAPDPMAVEAQRQQRAENQAVRSERKQDVLEKGIRRARGGSGRRSLLSKTSKGGMGYYNEYL